MASYPPHKFASGDLSSALDIARQTKFATLVHAGNDGLITIHAPMTVVGTGEAASFVGHIACNNPLYEVLRRKGDGISARLIFQPAQGYVSPSVYGEKAVTGKVVPTWNYVAAHFDGRLRLSGEENLMETLRVQTHDYEGASGGDWRIEDAPEDYTASLSKMIAGLSFDVTNCLCIRKLSQNKLDDLERVSRWLNDNQPQSASIAHWMRRLHDL